MSRPYTLHGYWRSSASWRVRWALLLKQIPFDYVPVNILKGENKGDEYLKLNPTGLLPMLSTPESERIVQSMAMLEYLDQVHPNPCLFGDTPIQGAMIRTLCEIINADTAPLQTPRVQKHHSSDAAAQTLWAQDWIRSGLRSFSMIRPQDAIYSARETLSAADLVLIPQVYNALRYKIDVAAEFPELMRIYDLCLSTPAGLQASPDHQSDAQR
ncbi:MAG: maleylacetoacetate isomerase [Bdellovibrionota bacterium]